jgi:aminoglycoside 6'-N-acetyltransferase I
MVKISIHQCSSNDQPGWLALRMALWPHSAREEHQAEMAEMLRQPIRFIQFLAHAEGSEAVGLLEMSVRSDYVNGAESSPVVFLEGLFVVPEKRGRGIARQLVRIAEAWAVSHGYSELAADALLENETAQAVHLALGFEETERVVYFRKPLRASAE